MAVENLEVEGLAELEKKLLAIGDIAAQKKALRNAMTYASKPMLDAAKANVRYSSPDKNDVHIRDSVGRSTSYRKKSGATIVMRLGEKKKKITTADGTKKNLVYGHLLEFGGAPWLRPAFDANVQTFLKRFAQQLGKNIDKAVK